MSTVRSTYVLMIGIGAYRHISPLSKAAADARDLRATLADAGYPDQNMALLLDQQASKTAISEHLNWLAQQASPADTALIFFSGHGVRLIGGLWPGEYLCPVETRLGQVRDTAISSDEFSAALRAVRAGRLAVFLDACHAGGVGDAKDPATQVRAGLSASAYGQLASSQGRVIIASCRPEEVAWELDGMPNGLFTHYLLEALRGAAARPDGTIWLSDLFGYVYKHVSSHNLQHPFQRAVAEDFILVGRNVCTSARSSPPTAPTGSCGWLVPHRAELTQLRRAMHDTYDRSDFEILCHDLGLDYHDLRGETLETKMLYLIDCCRRRRRYERLVQRVLTDHPYLAADLKVQPGDPFMRSAQR